MSKSWLEHLKGEGKPAVPAKTVNNAPAEIGFSNIDGFAALQRMARMFTQSSMVPETFRGEHNIGNASIALDMAIRLHANPLMVMQNIYVVHGRPAWSAKFLIATLNRSGRFSVLDYEFQGEEGKDSWGCRAVAVELATGKKRVGPLVTIGLAKKEGWYGKSGSKWQTMPENMLMYRAGAWFVNSFAPDIAMGLPNAEELDDVIDVTPIQGEETAQEEKPAITLEQVEQKAKRGRKPKAAPAPAPAVEAEVVSEMETPEQPMPQEEYSQEEYEGFLCPENGAVVDNSVCDRCQLREGCSIWGVNENVVPE